MNPKICTTCNASIPRKAPGGFCPACLLRDAEEPPAPAQAVPLLEEIAAAFPRWEVLGLIGQGGMGAVYKVRQPSLDRTVAMKILSPELGCDPAFAERFAREARTLAKLNHPNIVTVFEHGEKDGFFYLLMEFVDGVNLRQAMRAGRFTPEQALAIVPDICDALQAAHAQGIWHRDIKPENILLDHEGKVKIADFGIARIVGDPQHDFTLTRTGNVLGSISYMAPEQHEKPHEVDHRADIYSLGVVIYEMLTGELPLGRFPAPSQRADVNSHIDGIVLKTLEKERELRQQSATEVKTEVTRAMQPGQNPLAHVASGKCRPFPVIAKLACGFLLTGILGIGFMVRIDFGFQERFFFGLISGLSAFVLGLISWRERLGKSTAVATACLSVIFVAFAMFTVKPVPVSIEKGKAMIRIEFEGLSTEKSGKLTAFAIQLAKARNARNVEEDWQIGDRITYSDYWNDGYVHQTYTPNHPMPAPEVEASMKASLKAFLHSNGIDESDVKLELLYGL